MDSFNNSLNEALKYHTEQERKSFEDAIDANPLESTNHTVYADWLDEQGEHEEAEFRRAMGEWAAHMPKGVSPEYRTSTGTSWHVGVNPTAKIYLGLPTGVRPEHFNPLTEEDWDRDWSVDPPERHRPTYASVSPQTGAQMGWQWDTYRDMEEAFRRSFKANRQSTSE